MQITGDTKRGDDFCPSCGDRAGLRPHDTYERYYIDVVDGSPAVGRIRIVRYICPECGRTFSRLPDGLPPHGPFCLHFIYTVLQQYYSGTGSISELCDTFQITTATLYRWRKRYSIPHEKRILISPHPPYDIPAECFIDLSDSLDIGGPGYEKRTEEDHGTVDADGTKDTAAEERGGSLLR